MKISKEHIISGIKNLPAKLKELFKTLQSFPHSGKYLLISFCLILFFLIITFPYDFLIKKKIFELEGKSFKSIEITGFEFSIFGETYIKNLVIVLNNNNEISCKNSILNLSINPVVLIKNSLKSDFQFDSLKYISREFEFTFNINGNINLTLDKQSGIPKDGTVKIILSDSNIRLNNLSIPGPMGPLPIKIESINIQSGNINTTVTNGILKFNSFKLTGTDISCEMSGVIELLNNSKLDLVVNIDSESAVLDQYKEILTSYIKNNILSLRIKGTMAKPELALISAVKNEN